jgi:hypothetical protein
MMKIARSIFCALFLAAIANWAGGCATDDPDSNISRVPWDQPQNWEGPLPSTINQGR